MTVQDRFFSISPGFAANTSFGWLADHARTA
jgi:hypothetical protein